MKIAASALSMIIRRFPWDFARWRAIPYALRKCHDAYVAPEVRVVRTRHQFRMRIDISEWLGRHIFVTGEYEPATTTVIKTLLPPGATFIDVGANAGYFSLLAANCVGPNGRVMSFEPIPFVRESLTSNLSLNRVRNCKVFDIALSNNNGECAFFVGPQSHYGTSSLRTLSKCSSSLSVTTRRMDDVLSEAGPIDMVKIDVEGAEAHVLEGMREILSKSTPDVVLEVSPKYLEEMGRTVDDIDRAMAGFGYAMYAIEHSGIRQLPNLREYGAEQFNAFFTVRSQLPMSITVL